MVAIRINGKAVTEEEAKAHTDRRKEIMGDTADDWLTGTRVRLNTDDTMFSTAKAGWGADELPPEYAQALIAAGGSPVGKRYFKQLAKKMYDPEAWVSSRGEIKALCEKRGWTVTGAVTATRSIDCQDPGPEVNIDNDIIMEETVKRLIDNPDLAPTLKEQEALFHEIRDERKPHWSKD